MVTAEIDGTKKMRRLHTRDGTRLKALPSLSRQAWSAGVVLSQRLGKELLAYSITLTNPGQVHPPREMTIGTVMTCSPMYQTT